jgi:malate synthase
MTSDKHSNYCTLTISPVFGQFIDDELLPAIGIGPETFWTGLEAIIDDLSPSNRALLEQRLEIQKRLDDWHIARRGKAWSHNEYVDFLKEIGYLVPEGEPFSVATENVDREIAEVAGPQLVVPVSNPRFATIRPL